jgi:hypothetical protein
MSEVDTTKPSQHCCNGGAQPARAIAVKKKRLMDRKCARSSRILEQEDADTRRSLYIGRKDRLMVKGQVTWPLTRSIFLPLTELTIAAYCWYCAQDNSLPNHLSLTSHSLICLPEFCFD